VSGSHTARVGWPSPKKEHTHVRSDTTLYVESSNPRKLIAPH
jgi:hypothetical protein